jgi:hypothetical protein
MDEFLRGKVKEQKLRCGKGRALIKMVVKKMGFIA